MNLINIFTFIKLSYKEYTKTSKGDIEWLVSPLQSTTQFISIRGSEFYGNKWGIDLLRNCLAIIPWYSKELQLWVSFGYYSAAKRCAKDIPKYTNIKHQTPIVLCGHSLGAAISFLTAALLSRRGYNVKYWVGIGSANSVITFPTKLSFKTYNYKYEEDVVFNYPPGILGFKQPCDITNIGIDNSNKLRLGDIGDHSVDNYINFCPDIKL